MQPTGREGGDRGGGRGARQSRRGRRRKGQGAEPLQPQNTVTEDLEEVSPFGKEESEDLDEISKSTQFLDTEDAAADVDYAARGMEQTGAEEERVAAEEQHVPAEERNVAAGEQPVAAGEQFVAAGEQSVAAGEQSVAAGKQHLVMEQPLATVDAQRLAPDLTGLQDNFDTLAKSAPQSGSDDVNVIERGADHSGDDKCVRWTATIPEQCTASPQKRNSKSDLLPATYAGALSEPSALPTVETIVVTDRLSRDVWSAIPTSNLDEANASCLPTTLSSINKRVEESFRRPPASDGDVGQAHKTCLSHTEPRRDSDIAGSASEIRGERQALLPSPSSDSCATPYNTISSSSAREADSALKREPTGDDSDIGNKGLSGLPTAPKKLSPWAATLNFTVAMVGSGTVSMPYFFRLTGLGMGIMMLFFSALLSWVSALIFVREAELTQSSSFVELAYVGVPNPRVRFWFVDMSIILMVCGSTAAYIIIARNVLDCILMHCPAPSEPASLLTLMVIFLVMTLSSLARSYERLSFVSTFCFVSFLVIVALICYKSNSVGRTGHRDSFFRFDSIGFLVCLPMMSCAMNGHMNVPGIYSELSKKHKEFAAWIAGAACLLVALFYSVAGIPPFLAFGSTTESDVLKQLFRVKMSETEEMDVVVFIAQLLLATTIVFKTPLIVFSVRLYLFSFWSKDVSTCTAVENFLVTVGCVSTCFFMALLLPRLDLVIQLVGATAGTSLLYTIPGYILLQVDKNEKWRCVATFLFITGVCISAICTVMVLAVEFGLISHL